jgi:peptidoglycan DL-endopeptidase CwlO
LRTARRLLQIGVFAAVVAGVVLPGTGAIAAAKPSLASLQQQIKEQSTALEKIVEQYNKVTIDLGVNVKAAAKVSAEMKPTQRALDAARGKLAGMAASAYMGGKISSLSAILDANSTLDLLDQMATVNQLATEKQRQISGVLQLQTAYQDQKQSLDNLIAAENAKRAELAKQKATILTKLATLYKVRAEAYGSPTVRSGGSHPPPPYLPGRGGKVVKFAYAQLGKPYAWAQDGPRSYDCSGLTLAAYRSVGISLPHNARAQWGVVHHISRAELSPGDLVFYESLGHVAIYIGNSKVIHAPTFGDVVKISPITMMSPYGYGRV